MATIEELMLEWDEDSTIDDNHVDRESVNTPKLHAKYIRYLIQAKLKNTKLHNDYNELKKTKFRYYRGELSRDELADLGWLQYQYAKPLKNEMEQILEGDIDLNVLKVKLEYIGSMIYLLESILGQIKARDWQLRNVVSWKTFINGG